MMPKRHYPVVPVRRGASSVRKVVNVVRDGDGDTIVTLDCGHSFVLLQGKPHAQICPICKATDPAGGQA